MCENPNEPCATCDGYWTCEDIHDITLDIMAALDSNGDGQINQGDEIEESHLADLNAYCDFNGDGQTDKCEIHDCLLAYENTWRDENCPGYGYLYCDSPFEPCV